MSYKRVYVGKLPRDVTEKELRRLFDEFGRIKEIRVLVGFAFVEYDDARDARDAVEKLDNSRFLGERITVEPSKVQRDDRDRDRRRDDRGAERGDRYEPRGGSGTARGSGKNRLKIENLPSRISWQWSSQLRSTHPPLPRSLSPWSGLLPRSFLSGLTVLTWRLGLPWFRKRRFGRSISLSLSLSLSGATRKMAAMCPSPLIGLLENRLFLLDGRSLRHPVFLHGL
ncbi:hypothetical protein BC830DRAFT_961089 [Chytriomyces sp. MP71]|nr:hypothetical protein BC830DRAFT_961089 [Chytriomyces sp. MP71]